MEQACDKHTFLLPLDAWAARLLRRPSGVGPGTLPGSLPSCTRERYPAALCEGSWCGAASVGGSRPCWSWPHVKHTTPRWCPLVSAQKIPVRPGTGGDHISAPLRHSSFPKDHYFRSLELSFFHKPQKQILLQSHFFPSRKHTNLGSWYLMWRSAETHKSSIDNDLIKGLRSLLLPRVPENFRIGAPSTGHKLLMLPVKSW